MRTIKEIMETIPEEKRQETIEAIRSTKDLKSFKKAVKEYGIEVTEEEQEMVFEKRMKKKILNDTDLDIAAGGIVNCEDWGNGEIIDC